MSGWIKAAGWTDGEIMATGAELLYRPIANAIDRMYRNLMTSGAE